VTPAEHAQMRVVLETLELGCVQYRGRDPQIIEVVRKHRQ
jgi:hypothetical protein